MGYIDVAFTYNEAAELAELKLGKAVKRELVFMVCLTFRDFALACNLRFHDLLLQDHFYLVGPASNPAKLDGSSDNVSDMFNKIVSSGNADVIVRQLSSSLGSCSAHNIANAR